VSVANRQQNYEVAEAGPDGSTTLWKADVKPSLSGSGVAVQFTSKDKRAPAIANAVAADAVVAVASPPVKLPRSEAHPGNTIETCLFFSFQR
jgi:hypothetical protein